ncbi:MAG TPA: hypothetical protein VFR41_15010 [Acidimicrobiia bacterium]|nr:hypothetical protein [Acidimicrobiia bacterium]
MDQSTSPTSHPPQLRPRRTKAWVITGAAALGAAIGAAGIAGAATSSTSTTAPPSASQPAFPPGGNPATVGHGPGETLLTGTTADKVKAAALAAVPNSTILRVETDSDGSPYEAHLQKSDGSYVTVKVDANFKVTATDQGFGRGPGGPPPGGPSGSGAVSPSGA